MCVFVIAKSGQCPTPDKRGACDVGPQCYGDADCNGKRKCCNNGCGYTCQIPGKDGFTHESA